MAVVAESELHKLLSTAIAAAKKAEDGNSAEEGRTYDTLRVLEKQVVTTDLLQRTEAGKKIKKLSKHSSSKISAAASAVVEAWKNCVRNESTKKQVSSSQPEDSQPPAPIANRAKSADASVLATLESQSTSTSQGLESYQVVYNPNNIRPKPSRCGDDVRDKVRMMFAEGLVMAVTADTTLDPNQVAVEIEQAMYNLYGSVNNDYKNKARSLSFNLKDQQNPDCRGDVMAGLHTPEAFIKLPAEALASRKQKQENHSVREKMKAEAVRGQATAASTDMFQCGRCKQSKCTYYQMQTRSADEPMTTFVTCTVCGQRWKFC